MQFFYIVKLDDYYAWYSNIDSWEYLRLGFIQKIDIYFHEKYIWNLHNLSSICHIVKDFWGFWSKHGE